VATLACTLQLGAAQAATSNPAASQAQPTASANDSAARTNEQSDPALTPVRSLVQQGKLDEAEQALHHYLAEHANSAEAHYLLGYTYFEQVHQKMSSPAGNGSVEFSILDGDDAKTSEAKATASLAEYTAGAKYHDPSSFDLKVVALDYVLLKDYPDADKWLTKSLDSNPKDAEGWYYLGRTKYNENRFDEAITAFQQYLKLEPKSVRGEDNLGLSYQGLGRTEDAIAAYKTAILWQKDLLNQDPGPFVNLGALLLDENQPEQAVSYLVQAVSISPQYAHAHEQLGKAYDRLAQLAKAQAELEKAVELAPQNARLHYILGQVYRKQGLTGKAKLEFDRSAVLRQSHPSTEEADR
jgi:tetratricopeptide (TPR) repeat protein